MLPDPNRPILVGAALAAALATTSIILFWLFAPGGEAASATISGPETALTTSTVAATETTGTTRVATTVIEPTIPTSTTVFDTPLHPWVDARTVGQPYGSAVEGLLTFRGNPTNTYYGTGPIPTTPEIEWSYPDTPMCSTSTDLGVTSTWCGNGWTGQPVVWERPDGVTELIFGAYDRRLHFVDADSGQPTRSPILTGDIIKGTPTIDPDGYPLVYFGSRDNKLRIVALDRTDPVVIWDVEADLAVEGRWNDDWDAAPRIVNDIMFEGAENGIFYIYKLNRDFDDLGLVSVEPELLFKMETWTEKLLNDIGPSYPAVSVENSAALFEGRVYFANSGGRVIGLDITKVEDGEAPIVFDYWVGDDVDASIVVDEEGMLYVSVEYERYLDRAKSLGQLIKLDPYTDGDPYQWGMFSLIEDHDQPAKGGMWSTPALGQEVLYTVTNKGLVIAVDRETGEEVWWFEVGAGSWSSPAIVDGHLIVAGNTGLLRSFFIGADERDPVLQWTFEVGDGNIESTPAVWDGMIFVGNRDGFMYAVGQQAG